MNTSPEPGYPAPNQQQPQQYQSRPRYAAPPYGTPGSTAGSEPFNTFGAIALALVVVLALTGFLLPFLYRSDLVASSYSVVGLITGVISWGLILLVIGFGIGGLLAKRASRGRWTAIAALGVGGYAALSSLCSLVGNWVASMAMPF